MPEKATAYSGVLLIDKPAGPTSHDVVNQIRRLISEKAKPRGRQRRLYAVGHAGTLDPFATGVLIVALGSATRLLEYTRDLPKTYLATLTLGATSDTDDRTGQINVLPRTKRKSPANPGEGVIHHVLQSFIGPIQQVPPQYSAIKIAGQRAYQQARVGKSVDLKPRPVNIYSIKLLAYSYPTLKLEVTCGRGTYIRALARDIGHALNTGAYVQELRRTSVGNFVITDAIAPDTVSATSLSLLLLPPQKLVEHLPHISLTLANVAKFQQGQGIALAEAQPAEVADKPIAIVNEDKSLVGIGKFDPPASLLHPIKVLS